jgi:pSer/pThr/pTyr-binding forkhead associated (FHA) protein
MKLLLQTCWPLDENREIAIQRFPFVIGRRTNSDCNLSLPFVSRRHCQFVRIGDEVLVQDLKSHNGTFVNGKRASRPLPVQDGDELMLGHCSFRVSMLDDTGDITALRMGLADKKASAVPVPPAGNESSINSEECMLPQPKPLTMR